VLLKTARYPPLGAISVFAPVTSAVAHDGYSGRAKEPLSYRRYVNEQAPRPRVFSNRFADAVGSGDIRTGYDLCSCFDYAHVQVPARKVRFHRERQDTSAPGWLHMLALIDEAAGDGREVFRPLVEISPEERRQVITLPPSVGKLTAVKHLVLYRSNLVRLPAEIGAMASLEMFEPYTSQRLHWFPYELTRCRNLKSSAVSTRLIFGNFKYRPPFPELRQGPVPPEGPDPGLWGADSITSCSVCGGPVPERGVRQVWLSARVATDVLPLLVNACSDACVGALPQGAEGHVRVPHSGGLGVVQPKARYAPRPG
jgi:hypothetical protein